ncbi:hypothetical protein [Mobiluncus porci]|uniref:PIN domain-containing protein n=1 Tax=Mobiluncus porci TaxID=2652278 RepID=A0A7K0K3U0_9ACTO|nr:hypothetical protein [Mobiluncus porci]MST50141.1 hypothetical protein [Mobiluncus porci]
MSEVFFRVFLDANVLAKPVTRTQLTACGPFSGFLAVWSKTAETEANRHLRPRMISVTEVRQIYGGILSPTGKINDRFTATSETDRQILADAAASNARFLITEDVDDFAEPDLQAVGTSAVNPDLFLSKYLNREAYARIVNLFAERQVSPPHTPAEIHAAIARQHPRLFSTHADLFEIEPCHLQQILPQSNSAARFLYSDEA